MPRPNINSTVWCDRGFFPFFYGFCPSAAAWSKDMKSLKPGVQAPEYPDNAGACSYFTNRNGRSVTIITIAEFMDKRTLAEVVGLIAHEAVHVYQEMLRAMKEDARPSPEFEAYSVQAITQELFEAYCATRRKKWLSIK